MTKRIVLGHAPSLDIEVTQEIIDKAIERDSSHCVNADALRAHLDKLEARSNGRHKFGAISVDLQTIRFTDSVKKERYVYLTPRSAQLCLIDFDQGKKPTPFAFRLRTGQTTVSGNSDAQNAKARARKAARALDQKQHERETISQLVDASKPDRRLRKPEGGSLGSVPEIVGGRTPPIAAVSVSKGLRRQFGLRALDR